MCRKVEEVIPSMLSYCYLLSQDEVPIVVYDNINCKNPSVVPDDQTATGSVKTFFCISRGSVQVTLG